MPHKRTLLTLATAAVLMGGPGGCVETTPPQGAPTASTPAPTPPPLSTEPIGVQVTRAEPRLANSPFRVLLDFERPTDLAFVTPRGPAPHTATDKAHTGAASLALPPGATVAVKLGSLTSGNTFPGTWTLAGGYFLPSANAPTRVTLAYRVPSAAQPLAQRSVDLPATDKWTPVFLDLTPLAANPPAEVGQLTVLVESSAPTWCDDVLIVNNAQTFETAQLTTAATDTAAPDTGWTIKQGGFDILVERPARFKVTLKTPEAAHDGWTVEETSDLRARFASTGGKFWTLYPDGRQYKDGAFSALVPAVMGPVVDQYAQQHLSPAEMLVPEEFGRVDRDTPGDRNNDGYNERRGSYQLVAKGGRFEVTLRPHALPLVRPVLEIAGLPQGTVLAVVEGQLIEKTTRLPSGNLLVELPLALRRPTTLNITVK